MFNIKHINNKSLKQILLPAIVAVLAGSFLLLNPSFTKAEEETIDFPHGPVPEASISITSSSESTDGINMLADPGNGNNITTASDVIEVATTTATGYTLRFSSNSPDNTDLTHQSLLSYSIPTLPTNNSPLDNNTWGYTLTNPTTPTTANFSSVPNSDTPDIIKTTNEATTLIELDDPNNLDPPDITDIYYGAKVNLDIPSGLYKTVVLYTALANFVEAPSIPDPQNAIQPNTGPVEGGTEITITGINLYSTINVTIGGLDCTDIHILSETQITCITPDSLTEGPQDVVITTQGGIETIIDGFTFQPSTPTYCGTFDYECIIITIDATGGTYQIPTSGRVANMDHAYDWLVYIDDVLINNTIAPGCNNGNCTGTSGTTAPNANGVALTGMSATTHQIKILPNGNPTPGWGNAFGYHGSITAGTANVAVNKQKLISLDAPLTTMAFAPKTTESTTTAIYMFANLFYSCTNLITSATIIDTYKLPNTITDLSYFLQNTHYGNNNTNFTSPIDLVGLSGWFDNNNSITNLSYFLQNTHAINSYLSTPINLTPLSGWFNNNNSIINLSSFLSTTHSGNSRLTSTIVLPMWSFIGVTDLSSFLYGTHSGNSQLTASISLTPISGWFNANNSITNLSGFLGNTHTSNTQLTTPTDLTPLNGWFNNNSSLTNLSGFLSTTHASNSSLTTSIVLPSWSFTSVTNLNAFLCFTHDRNGNLLSPISLIPAQNWFYHNNSVTSMSRFLGGGPVDEAYYMGTHYNNDKLVSAIDLTPISDWFYANNSITNLSDFLNYVHSNNLALTAPISLTPIGNWFNANNTITNLSYFLDSVHRGNVNLLAPISLAPITNWFNANSSIVNLGGSTGSNIRGGFLYYTHSNNTQITTPVNLTPLSGWFSNNRSFTSLDSFLSSTHSDNTNLTLNGQTIFPNWIKTATQGVTPIWNVSLSRIFYLSSTQGGDTGEVKFQDGTVLSSLGVPSLNRLTYTGRTGIAPVNINWQ